MLDYARAGEHRIMLRALREGLDTTTPTGRAVAAIMATLAELELEPGCERRAQSRESRRARSMPATQPYKLSPDRHEQLRRLAVTKLGNRTGNLGNRSAQPVDSQTPRLTGTTPIRQIDTQP